MRFKGPFYLAGIVTMVAVVAGSSQSMGQSSTELLDNDLRDEPARLDSQDDGASEVQNASSTVTERLLEAQRSQRYASDERQALSGKVQSRIYERYVDSFSRPVPDTFIDDSFGSDR